MHWLPLKYERVVSIQGEWLADCPYSTAVFQVYRFAVVGLGGLEPPTSRLSGVRSNHLSYAPKLIAWLFVSK